ncbi:MAG: sugar phosphate isomerase/epimerase [Planctomycetales bacterium]|nr:sugar phosphate isomerase/epimerase [Planctomycetales bacterium]
MLPMSRRSFLATSSMSIAALAMGETRGDERRPAKMGLGFSLYGMKSLSIDDGLKTCREIGYDCVELPIQADWPWDSRALSRDETKRIGGLLERTGLRLSSLMENLHVVVDDARHQDNLERLKLAAELAHALSPKRPAVIETILGGKPAQWDDVRRQMADRLKDWARVAEEGNAVIAIKPHVGGAMHRPEHALWLLEQVDSSHVRAAYDYSHYQLRSIDMAESIQQLAPESVFIHVKDAAGDANRVQFLLPGEGTVDYARYLKLVAAAGYEGDVVVEVSGQIHGKPNYDPIAAAKKSYAPLAAAFEKAGVARG